MFKGNEPWVPNELQHAGRENRDPEHAAQYDQKEDAGAAQEVALLREHIGLESTVIDLGAGTGQFALAVSSAVKHVTAVDVSPVMLSLLDAKLKSRGVKNVDCKVAGFLTYAHEGRLADLVYSRYALHHLPDFWKALALTRMATFLRPGGVLRLWDVVYSFDPAHAPQRIEQWMAAFAPSQNADEWTRADLEEHVRDEHSTFSWLLEPMIEKAGFSIESIEYSEDQMFAKYLCVKRPTTLDCRWGKR